MAISTMPVLMSVWIPRYIHNVNKIHAVAMSATTFVY